MFPPLEAQSISFILNAGFQQREGQSIETERTIVNFVHLEEERRGRTGKKCPVVNLANCRRKTEM